MSRADRAAPVSRPDGSPRIPAIERTCRLLRLRQVEPRRPAQPAGGIAAAWRFSRYAATATSVPAKVGVGKALGVARLTHAGCVVLLVLLGWESPRLEWLYWVGVAGAIGLLVVEHAVVRADDLSRVGLAFFTLNGVISLLLGTLGVIDILISARAA